MSNAVDQPLKEFGPLDYMVVTAENLKLLLLFTAAVGIVAFVIASFLPKTYTSVSFVNLSPNDAMESGLLITSVAVNAVADKFPEADGASDTPDSRRRALAKRVRWAPAGDADKRTANLYALEVSQSDPERARKINAALVSTWLDLTKPKANLKARLETQLSRNENELASISKIIAFYESQPLLSAQAKATDQNGVSPISDLFRLRLKLEDDIDTLKVRLSGKTADVIVSPADAPVDPRGPRRGIISAGAAAIAFLLGWLFVCLREAVGRVGPNDIASLKLARVSIALRLWKK